MAVGLTLAQGSENRLRMKAFVAAVHVDVLTGNCLLTSSQYWLKGDSLFLCLQLVSFCPKVAKNHVIKSIRLVPLTVQLPRCWCSRLTQIVRLTADMYLATQNVYNIMTSYFIYSDSISVNGISVYGKSFFLINCLCFVYWPLFFFSWPVTSLASLCIS